MHVIFAFIASVVFILQALVDKALDFQPEVIACSEILLWIELVCLFICVCFCVLLN